MSRLVVAGSEGVLFVGRPAGTSSCWWREAEGRRWKRIWFVRWWPCSLDRGCSHVEASVRQCDWKFLDWPCVEFGCDRAISNGRRLRTEESTERNWKFRQASDTVATVVLHTSSRTFGGLFSGRAASSALGIPASRLT